MSTKPDIRLGIVGCGEHSHVHAAAAGELFDVEIVCACDVNLAHPQPAIWMKAKDQLWS